MCTFEKALENINLSITFHIPENVPWLPKRNSLMVNDVGSNYTCTFISSCGVIVFEEVLMYDRGTAESGNFAVSKHFPVGLYSQYGGGSIISFVLETLNCWNLCQKISDKSQKPQNYHLPNIASAKFQRKFDIISSVREKPTRTADSENTFT